MCKSIVLLTLLTALHVGAVHAEGGCPPGQYPQEGNGWRSCVPMSGSSAKTQDSEFVAPHYEARWISLAIDSKKGILGRSRESKTEIDAEQSAQQDCSAKGGLTCHPIATSKNSCVVMVASDSTVFGDGGPTKRSAEEKGMSACNDASAKNCYVYYSACVEPVIK